MTFADSVGRSNRAMMVLAAFAVLAIVAGFVWLRLEFRTFTNPSDGMAPTAPEDSFMVAKITRDVSRGDVVYFLLPRDGRTIYIKRLVGMPGDRVRFDAGVLSINGVEVSHRVVGKALDQGKPVTLIEEQLPGGARYRTFDQGPDHDGDTTDEYIVPAGQYFMLGDNRDNSLDSRWPPEYGVGFVPAKNLLGKMVWPTDGRSP